MTSHRWTYANANPSRFTDPDGRFCVPCAAIALPLIGIALSANNDIGKEVDEETGELVPGGASLLPVIPGLGRVGVGARGAVKTVGSFAARNRRTIFWAGTALDVASGVKSHEDADLRFLHPALLATATAYDLAAIDTARRKGESELRDLYAGDFSIQSNERILELAGC